MKKEIKKSPFFAKLLEKQVKNSNEAKGGDRKTNWREDIDFSQTTLKYPSDTDEEYTMP